MEDFQLENPPVIEIAATATFGGSRTTFLDAETATTFINRQLPEASSVERRPRFPISNEIQQESRRDFWIVRAWSFDRSYCLQVHPRRLSVSFVRTPNVIPTYSLLFPIFHRHLEAYMTAFGFEGTRRVALEYVDDVELPDDNFDRFFSVHLEIPRALSDMRSCRIELEWEEAPFVNSLELERSAPNLRQVRLSWLSSATAATENSLGGTLECLSTCHRILRERFFSIFTSEAMEHFRLKRKP
jgi:uncharacterized protein (TIGR04255 family)